MTHSLTRRYEGRFAIESEDGRWRALQHDIDAKHKGAQVVWDSGWLATEREALVAALRHIGATPPPGRTEARS